MASEMSAGSPRGRRGARQLLRALAALAAVALAVALAGPAGAQDPNQGLCEPVAPILNDTTQMPSIVKDDLGADTLSFTISTPRVQDRRMEIYLGSDPTSTICARSTVFSTDYTTCADLYLLKDTWDNLKQCGWNTTEDDQFLTFINTIHVRVYDNIKNPVGGFYTHTTGLKAPVTVSFAKDPGTPDDPNTDGDNNPDTPNDGNDGNNVDDGTPNDVDVGDSTDIPAPNLATQNAYKVVKLAVDNSAVVRQTGPRRLYIFIAVSYFNPYVLSPRGVDLPDTVFTSDAVSFIVATPDCADDAPVGSTLCTRGGEIIVTLAEGVCDIGGNYTVSYDRCQDTAAAPDADPTDPDCATPYEAKFYIPEGTTVCSNANQDNQALEGITADAEPDRGATEPNYEIGSPVNIVVQARSEVDSAPLTSIILVGVSVTSSADGIARDLVKDEQPTDLGKETQVVWPQPIDATSGQAIVSFTPTFGAPDAMIPEEEFDGERQFGVTITLRLYYPMQGFSDARRRGRRLLGRFVGRETAAKLLPPKLVKRQDDVDGESDVPQLEELVEVDVVAAFNYGTNFDLNTPTDQPDNPGDDDGLPDPNGGPNEWSSRPADFWSSGVMGYLALGFGLIALITTWIKALAGGDNVSDVVVESARPRIFNILPSFMDIVTLSQQIFMLGCLNLGTTDMFNRFAGNFKWSMLVFRVPFLQNLAAQIYSTEQYFTYPTGPYPIVPRRLQTRLYEPGMEHMDKGMQATAFEIGINLGDYFITSFFLFLIVQLVLMVGGAMALFILEIRHEVSHVAKYRTVRTSIVTWTFAAVVRFFNFFYMPLVLFCVFQMSYDNKNDYVPWYLTFWCVVVFVSALLVLPGYICYKIFSTWPKDGLYSNDRKLLVLGTFYNTYKVQKLWFVVADFGYRFLSGCFVGMGFTNGYVQSSLWAIVILTYAVMVGVQKPYSRKERNWYVIIQSGVMLFSLVLLWSCNPDLPYPTRQSLSFATTIILCAFMVLCGVWVMYSLWKGVVYYAAVRKEGRARGFESMELDSHYDYAQPLNGKGYGADGEYSDDTHYVEDDQYVHYHDEDKLLPSYNPEPITLSFGSSPKSATGPLANPATQRSRWSTAGSGAGGSGTGHSSKSKKSSRHAERAEAGSEAVPSFDDIMRNPRSSQYVAPAPEDPSASLAMEDPSMEATSRANATLESVRGKMKSYSSKKSTSYDG